MKHIFQTALTLIVAGILAVSCETVGMTTGGGNNEETIAWSMNASVSNYNPKLGETVIFTDNSKGVKERSWTFEDGTPATSTEDVVEVVFNTTGEKRCTVKMIFSDKVTRAEETFFIYVEE